MSSLVRHILFCLALAIALWGCKSSKKSKAPPAGQGEIPQPQEDWSTQPMSVPGAPDSPVKRGSAPMVYLVEQPTMIRVVDMTSGEVLLRMPVQARTLVAVDARTGVRVGSATMKLGPLSADHEFGIYLESTETNITRRGTIRPGKPSEAPIPNVATQPARNP